MLVSAALHATLEAAKRIHLGWIRLAPSVTDLSAFSIFATRLHVALSLHRIFSGSGLRSNPVGNSFRRYSYYRDPLYPEPVKSKSNATLLHAYLFDQFYVTGTYYYLDRGATGGRIVANWRCP